MIQIYGRDNMEIIFENTRPIRLYPLTLTRDACDIMVGGITLREMIELAIKKGMLVNSGEKIIIDACIVPSTDNIRKIYEGKLDSLDKIKYPHETIIWNKMVMKDNLEILKEGKKEIRKDVFAGERTSISDNVVFDSSEGLIVLEDDVVIGPFSYIKGPVFIGKGTIVKEHSSIKSHTSISRRCKIGGEVEGSIIHEFSNKSHYGFLGDSVIGSWVNLGAGTTNSNLKNTYGEISVIDGEGRKIMTKEQFLGCVIGDYSRTAINTSIFTGKIIGVNSMIYGTVVEDVPSFINMTRAIGIEDDLFDPEKAIEVQRRVFARRGIEQKDEDKETIRSAFKSTRGSREIFLKKRR